MSWSRGLHRFQVLVAWSPDCSLPLGSFAGCFQGQLGEPGPGLGNCDDRWIGVTPVIEVFLVVPPGALGVADLVLELGQLQKGSNPRRDRRPTFPRARIYGRKIGRDGPLRITRRGEKTGPSDVLEVCPAILRCHGIDLVHRLLGEIQVPRRAFDLGAQERFPESARNSDRFLVDPAELLQGLARAFEISNADLKLSQVEIGLGPIRVDRDALAGRFDPQLGTRR